MSNLWLIQNYHIEITSISARLLNEQFSFFFFFFPFLVIQIPLNHNISEPKHVIIIQLSIYFFIPYDNN